MGGLCPSLELFKCASDLSHFLGVYVEMMLNAIIIKELFKFYTRKILGIIYPKHLNFDFKLNFKEVGQDF